MDMGGMVRQRLERRVLCQGERLHRMPLRIESVKTTYYRDTPAIGVGVMHAIGLVLESDATDRAVEGTWQSSLGTIATSGTRSVEPTPRLKT